MGTEDSMVVPSVDLTIGAILVCSWFSVRSFRRLGSEHANRFLIVPVDGVYCCNGFVGS